MRFNKTKIKGLYIAELDPLSDDRGFFTRTYCNKELEKINVEKPIKQINHSLTSTVGSIRGMHYQNYPYLEIKMVRCISGEVFDVAVDLRKDSDTFLQWHGEYLSAENSKMMIIPEGFAHGFQVIKPNSELLYFHTDFYSPNEEGAVNAFDPLLKIDWPLKVTEISERDNSHSFLNIEFKGIEIL